VRATGGGDEECNEQGVERVAHISASESRHDGGKAD
jgi:hypothetical protein